MGKIGGAELAAALDAGALDAGSLEATELDAGILEAAMLDAGILEAARLDAGILEAAEDVIIRITEDAELELIAATEELATELGASELTVAELAVLAGKLEPVFELTLATVLVVTTELASDTATLECAGVFLLLPLPPHPTRMVETTKSVKSLLNIIFSNNLKMAFCVAIVFKEIA